MVVKPKTNKVRRGRAGRNTAGVKAHRGRAEKRRQTLGR